MKKRANISRDAVDAQIWECQQCANRISGERESMYARWASYALTRYIGTGRASAQWLRMFCASNPAVLMKTAVTHGGSDDDCLKAVTRYLNRYYAKA